jgi:hypothetical protein
MEGFTGYAALGWGSEYPFMTAIKHVLYSNGGWLRIGPLGVVVSVICNMSVEVLTRLPLISVQIDINIF